MLPARRGAGFDDQNAGGKETFGGISDNLSETSCLLGLGGLIFLGESRTVLLLPVLRRAKEEGETDLAFLAS